MEEDQYTTKGMFAWLTPYRWLKNDHRGYINSIILPLNELLPRSEYFKYKHL